jgi:D-glycerate 3-kinase
MKPDPDPQLMSLIQGWIALPSPRHTVPLIGIGGSQASGKSTLAKTAAKAFGAVSLSLDDVYLTKAERLAMAKAQHPLFAVRGAPGSHDLGLLEQTIAALSQAGPKDRTALPSFDKLADDRLPKTAWPAFEGRPTAIVIEGWCMGAAPIAGEALIRPVNSLEAEHDPQGVWRRRWNTILADTYQHFFGRLDALLFLSAPDFGVVLDWRCEQEAGLLGIAPSDLPPERHQALSQFIAHYQRLTQHMLDGAVTATATAALGPKRQLVAVSGPSLPNP